MYGCCPYTINLKQQREHQEKPASLGHLDQDQEVHAPGQRHQFVCPAAHVI